MNDLVTGGVDLGGDVPSFLQSVLSFGLPDLDGHFRSASPDLLKVQRRWSENSRRADAVSIKKVGYLSQRQ